MRRLDICLRRSQFKVRPYRMTEIIQYIRRCHFEYGLPNEIQCCTLGYNPLFFYFPSDAENMECVIRKAIDKFGIPYNVALHVKTENETNDVTLSLIFKQ